MKQPTPGSSRPRSTAAVYAMMLVVAFVAAAAFLITAPPVAPPEVAEYAPTAVQQITQAPPQQAVQNGQGKGQGKGAPQNGSGPGGTPTPTPANSPAKAGDGGTTVPKTFDCIRGRQIKDPQSPPCVPFWDDPKGNGGATNGPTGGVTKNEIKVVAPDGLSPVDENLQDFVNNHFERYNRTVKIIAVNDAAHGYTGKCDANSQEAWADKIVETEHPFASLEYTGCGGAFFRDYLARQYRVLSVGYEPLYTESHMSSSKMATYLWQYPMAYDRMFAQTADWACARLLSGSPTPTANHAGDPTLTSKPRQLGVVTMDVLGGNYGIDDSAFSNELSSACNVEIPSNHDVYDAHWNDDNTHASDTQFLTTTFNKFKTDGVTTVVCFCFGNGLPYVTRAASNAAFYPEWALNDFYQALIPSQIRTSDPTQTKNMMGVTFEPMDINAYDDPAIWALNEENPGAYTSPDYTAAGQGRWIFDATYREVLLLASGIQMAGPDLTPQTFAAGLNNTTFPNPDNPIMAGHVGFAGNSHSMTVDGAEWWWNNSAQSPYANDGSGAFCYVAGGARHAAGEWPRGGDPFFNGPCYTGAARVYG